MAKQKRYTTEFKAKVALKMCVVGNVMKFVYLVWPMRVSDTLTR